MKSSLFFTLICLTSFTGLAGTQNSSDVGEGFAPAAAPVFAHVGNPFDWLKSQPDNPEHIYLALVITRAFWTELLQLPKEFTDGICPTLAAIMTEALPGLSILVGSAGLNLPGPVTLTDENDAGEEAGESDDEGYESEGSDASYGPTDLGAGLEGLDEVYNEVINLAMGFFDLLTVWKSIPALSPFVMQTLTEFENIRSNPSPEQNAISFICSFNTIVAPVLQDLLMQIPGVRRIQLHSGLEELYKKILIPA